MDSRVFADGRLSGGLLYFDDEVTHDIFACSHSGAADRLRHHARERFARISLDAVFGSETWALAIIGSLGRNIIGSVPGLYNEPNPAIYRNKYTDIRNLE